MFRKKRNKAQGIVEFALVLPFLMIILGVLVDSCQMFYAKGMTYYGAYTGARAASVSQSWGDGYRAAQSTGLKNMPTTLDVKSPNMLLKVAGPWQKGSLETATAQMTAHLLIPMLDPNGGGIASDFKSTYTISSSMTMMIER